MADQTQRIDPADRYYKSAQLGELCSNVIFWAAVILSFAVLFVEKNPHPVLYQILEIAFALAVIALFILGMALRLCWSPRAEEQRRLGFFSNAFDIPLTHEHTAGFYNNPATEPLTRIGLSLTENCFFSRAVTLEMLKVERIIVILYIVFFVTATLIRNTDIALVPIAAQAVFSEQIISRWLRLEWLSARCGDTYKRLYDLFQAPPSARIRNARILDALTAYETAKANAGIALSSKIFHKLNPTLSKEWSDILTALNRGAPAA